MELALLILLSTYGVARLTQHALSVRTGRKLAEAMKAAAAPATPAQPSTSPHHGTCTCWTCDAYRIGRDVLEARSAIPIAVGVGLVRKGVVVGAVLETQPPAPTADGVLAPCHVVVVGDRCIAQVKQLLETAQAEFRRSKERP